MHAPYYDLPASGAANQEGYSTLMHPGGYAYVQAPYLHASAAAAPVHDNIRTVFITGRALTC